MGSARATFVQQGFYEDYSGSRKQWLLTTGRAFWVTTFLAVFASIALPRLLRIVLRVLDVVRQRRPAAVNGQNQWYGRQEHAAESLGYQSIREGILEMQPGAIRLPNAQLDPHRIRNGLKLIGKGLSWFGLYICFLAISSVTTAKIATGSRALSKHPDCGLYELSNPESQDSAATSQPWEFFAQTDSANWAKNCYLNTIKDGCGLFTSQSIEYDVQNWTCPFAEHLCYGNGVSPIRLSTGSVDGRAIGVDAPVAYEFNRTTICTPLNMNRTYINLISNQGTDSEFGYYYGPAVGWDIENVTWISRRHNGIGEDASYLTFTLNSWGKGSNSVWTPRPELQPPEDATTKILFILSQTIFYMAASYDPIFPAVSETRLSHGEDRKWYWNLAGPGTVMACQDYVHWRDPSRSNSTWATITDTLQPEPKDLKVAAGKRLLGSALLKSNTFRSTNVLGGHALNATSRISGLLSLPLHAEQWKVEAETLFKFSLARIQVELHNIARGAYANHRGSIKLNNSAFVCDGTYIFNADGWVNLNRVFALLVIILSATFFVLAIPAGEEVLWPEVLFVWIRRQSVRGCMRTASLALRWLRGKIILLFHVVAQALMGIYKWGGWRIALKSIRDSFNAIPSAFNVGKVKGQNLGRAVGQRISQFLS